MCSSPSTIVCLVAANIGLALCVAAIATSHWIEGNTTNSTEVTNTTCHKGLWESTCGLSDAIVNKNVTEGMIYFTLTQYFYVFSAGTCLLGIIILYTVLRAKRCFGLLTTVFAISALLGLGAVIIITSSYQKENTFPSNYDNLFYGWSFWLTIPSVVAIFIATIASACTACSKREMKHRQYEVM